MQGPTTGMGTSSDRGLTQHGCRKESGGTVCPASAPSTERGTRRDRQLTNYGQGASQNLATSTSGLQGKEKAGWRTPACLDGNKWWWLTRGTGWRQLRVEEAGGKNKVKIKERGGKVGLIEW